MGHDSLSPFAPARIRCLLVPHGRIARPKFFEYVRRLQQESIVRLGDVSPSKSPDDAEFAPQTFPSGQVLYNFSTSRTPDSYRALLPFELFREDFVVLAVADGQVQAHQSKDGQEPDEGLVNGYIACVAALQEGFPSALIHKLVLFDHASPELQLPQAVAAIPPLGQANPTALKTAMAEITGSLLKELAAYAASIRSLSNIDTPRAQFTQSYPADGNLHRASQLSSHTSLHQSNDSDTQAPETSRNPNRASIPPHMSTALSEPTLDKRPASSTATSTGTNTPGSMQNGLSEAPERPASSIGVETQAQAGNNRMSMHGFGSGSIGERAREQAQSHISVVIGSICLLAGKWRDAVSELVKGATTAKANSDYIWLAKALDLLLVSLLMQAWAGMEFDIPTIMYPSGEKSASNKARRSKSISRTGNGMNENGAAEAHQVSLQNLHNLLRDLAYNISYFYSRAAEFNSIRVPFVIFSEAIIRLAKILIVVDCCEDSLEKNALDALVVQDLSRRHPNSSKPARLISGRGEIATFIYRAVPTSAGQEPISVTDRVHLLTGIATMLSDLGYHRKKAFILREVVALLLPVLIQSRKDSAAEQGLHPAASLSSLDLSLATSSDRGNELEHGLNNNNIQGILSLICEAYGVVSPGLQPSISSSAPSSGDQDTEFIALRAFDTARKRRFGNLALKSDVLRTCINVCEALPDLEGVLRFSSDLLCTGGSGLAPGPATVDASPSIAAEDQVRLFSNISKAASAAQQLGLGDSAAEYWDEFLVRDIVLIREDTQLSPPVLRHKEDLNLSMGSKAGSKQGPFIFDPHAAKSTAQAQESVLVVDEEASFILLLQNLYDIELEIEWIKLDCKDSQIESITRNIVIGPYRTQKVHISCTPKVAGQLAVSNCIASIRGCRARLFPLFRSPWRLGVSGKLKRPGLAGSELGQLRSGSEASRADGIHPSLLPRPSIFNAKIVDAQPTLTLKTMSFAQAALMVLDGERLRFTTVFKNISDAPIDLGVVSLHDNTVDHLKAVTEDKDVLPTIVYEEEVRAYRTPSLSLPEGVEREFTLEPQEELVLELEAFGKLGLSHGSIMVDYCHLNVPRAEMPDNFYSRHLTVDFNVTVGSSLGLVHNDVFSITEDLPRAIEQLKLESHSTSTSPALWHLLQHGPLDNSSDYCVLLFDFHNAWSESISVTLQRSSLKSEDAEQSKPLTVVVEPGAASRLLLPFPRLALPDAHASIPSLNPKNRRQYVVSSNVKANPELERTTRELFWCREEILNSITAKWVVHGRHGRARHGEVDLRRFILTARMLEALRKSDVEATLALVPGDTSDGSTAGSRFTASTSQFATLVANVRSHLSYPFQPHLRILPALQHQSYNVALDLGRKVAFNGVLQRTLPILKPGEETQIKIGMTFLAKGVYEIGAVVEELRLPVLTGQDMGSKKEHRTRPRAATGDFDLDVLAERTTRRAWYAREPCVVLVEDG